ncbi:VOC family protein [Streptomyces syringium]|uniref:Catechol 2,3-dioxygenase-like lactoylglutathione lyase family enzyme n=1 Tax=Streptomyces syringium TaxID=76729 RepID=A0ABS4XXE6_9ACTN|nr:VOC family protein [Streptomyces syringium]MBP2401178.1 catechol 2,3-dioxygenase-like lactoylglutathione lyase family enzyme [Streptomyces syringium]
MSTRLSHVTVPVLDQESAKTFYTEKLGFEVRDDLTLGALRWLTVGPKDQPDVVLVLRKVGPPEYDEETAAQLRDLVAKGVIGVGVLHVDNVRVLYERLRAAGVTFVQEPVKRPHGTEAVFRDDSGNWFSVTDSRG